VIGALAAALAVLAACGAGDDRAADYAATLTSTLAGDDRFVGDDEQARCFAAKVVGTFGADRLEEAGVTTAGITSAVLDDLTQLDVTAEEATALATALAECTGGAAHLLATPQGMDEACVAEHVTDEQIIAFTAAGILGQDPPEDLSPSLELCFP
jgi:hypothetical protein